MLKRVPFHKYMTTVDVRPMRFRSIVALEASIPRFSSISATLWKKKLTFPERFRSIILSLNLTPRD